MSNQVAETILEQLGGQRRFIRFTGASNFMSHGKDNALSFRLPSTRDFVKDGINYVKITLAPSDTYTLEFGRVWGLKYTILHTTEDIYCDMLQEVFTQYTGLDTHL